MHTPRFLFLRSAVLSLALAGCSGGLVRTPTPLENHCDASCKALWSLDVGGTGASLVNAVGVDSAGNVVFEAVLSGDSTLGAGTGQSPETVLAKLDPTGTILWKQTLPAGAGVPAMSVDAAGGIVLAGGSVVGEALDLGGGPIGSADPELSEIYVAALDASGAPVMSRGLVAVPVAGEQSSDYVSPSQVVRAPDGTLVVVGSFTGPLDFGDGALGSGNDDLVANVFVLKLDEAGDLLWSERFGTPAHPSGLVDDTSMFPASVLVDGDGSIVLGLSLFGQVSLGGQIFSSAGLSDVLVARLDASGGLVSAATFGGPQNDAPLSMALGPDGTLFVAGYVGGPVQLGSFSLSVAATASTAPFVAAIAPDGGVRWAVVPPQVPSPETVGFTVGVAATGDVVASLFDQGDGRVAVMQLDAADGTPSHVQTFTGTGAEDADQALALQSSAVDPLGNLVLAGAFEGTIDFGTGAPITTPTPYGGHSAFVAKVGP